MTIVWTDDSGWSAPEPCGWSCNEGFGEHESRPGECNSELEVPCNPDDVELPDNAVVDDEELVTIAWLESVGWSIARSCGWSCEPGYLEYQTAPGACHPDEPPWNIELPEISGDAMLGATLTATPGTWEDPQPVSVSYQWQRCDESNGESNGESCLDIDAADQPEYVPADEDVYKTIRVVVMATHEGGTTLVNSDRTDRISLPECTQDSECFQIAPWKICHEGQCLDCSPEETDLLCEHPESCARVSICNVPRLIFTSPQRLEGIGEDMADCGFLEHGGSHYALCSSRNEHGRLRPHVYTSSNGERWDYHGAMVPLPEGYPTSWGYSTSSFPNYCVHTRNYPVVLHDGTFRAAAQCYFHTRNGNEWLNFSAHFHSDDFLTWDGYRGNEEYGDDFVIAVGNEWSDSVSNVGVGTPTLGQQPDGTLVAYVRQHPHSNVDGSFHRRIFRRFTATLGDDQGHGISWVLDESFVFDAGDYQTDGGRFFFIDYGSDQPHVGFLHRRNAEGSEGCDDRSTQHWAFSSSGEMGTFTDMHSSIQLQVMDECGQYVDLCDIRAHFFASSSTGQLRVYYRRDDNVGDAVQHLWYSAIGRFTIESCD